MNIKLSKGFTLVELSIVLVIIGLLIGGIIAAQSMIGTTKLQSFIRQLNQMDIAVANFQTKYNYLPGDNGVLAAALPGATPGDGLITAGNSAFWGDDILYDGEIGRFWYDLSSSGFKTGSKNLYINCAASGACPDPLPGINAPASALDPKDIWLGLAPDNPTPGNYYIVGRFIGTASNIEGFDSGITPSQMAAIDKKIDDGFEAALHSGAKVYGLDAAGGSYPDLCDKNGTLYNVTKDATARCVPLIRMGISSGNLQ